MSNPTCRPMVDMWMRVIGTLAEEMGISKQEAAQLIMNEIANESDKIAEQEKMGLPVRMFGTMAYDPRKDPSHPMHGWNNS